MVDKGILANISGAFGVFLETYGTVLNILLSFVTISILILLIINIVRLGSAKEMPMLRRRSIKNVYVTGICLALISVVDTIYIVLLGLL